MKLVNRFVAIAFAVVFSGSQAFGLISGQVTVGKKWFEIDNNGSTSGYGADQTTFSVLLDPIPLVPVGVGASYSLATMKKGDLNAGAEEGAVSQLGLDLVAWVPMVPIVTPYAGARILVSSTMSVKSSTEGVATVDSEITGSELRLGIKYSLLPLVELMVEVNQGSYKIKPDGGSSSDMTSQAMLIGLDVGI